jgi:WD40 repeat protein
MFPRLLALAAVAALAPAAAAQQYDRRSREDPEVVVEAGGRVGPCDVLRFSPDGRFLLAGGDDKVVRVWPYSAAGLETEPGKAKVLRWPAWREQRGGVKAVAVSPDGTRVAVGGFGLITGTVAVLDRETGELVGLTWPTAGEGDPLYGTVHAVAFHPDGNRVAFGTADGTLWLWAPTRLPKPDADGRPSAPPVRLGKHEPDPKLPDFNFPRLLYFADDKTLVSVARSGEVLACDLAANPPAAKPLFDVNDDLPKKFAARVYRATPILDGKWLLIASVGPQVVLRSVDGKQFIRVPLPDDHFPRSVAFDPKTRRLAVGVGAALPAKDGQPRFYAEGNDEIWLFEKTTEAKEPVKLRHTGRAEALAFHPTENRLAVAGGDADEVTLIDLAAPDKPVSVVRGAGRQPWAVGLSADGSVIGVQTARDATSTDPNRRGSGPWARFDLTRLRPAADESGPWVGPVTSADGWTVHPTRNQFVWNAVLSRPGMPDVEHPLLLDRATDQGPTCWTFLPAAGGKPTRLLVGHYYGCSLFELTPESATRVRLYTGHGGEVTSVVAAREGNWFVTTGADQTVAAWGLADWRHHATFGAAFALNADGAVEVADVDGGSPAWEAGLVKGAVIDLLAVDSNLVYDRRAKRPPVGEPQAALAALKDPRSAVELFFGVRPPGQKRFSTLSTVQQRPLWKWFPAFNDRGRMTDWVIWMWHGSYYHTRTAHGDRLVGWHMNGPDPGDRPQFYQLQQFEKLFHRPDVIEKLLTSRDPFAALAVARGPNPTTAKFNEYEPAPVRIALRQSVVGPAGIALTVSVRPRGTNPDLLPDRVELWVNDHRLRVWDGNGNRPVEERLTIPPELFRAGDNRLVVQTFNPAGGRAEDVQVVRNPAAEKPPALLGLAVGINNYADHRKAVGGARAFGDLIGARADARDFKDRLLAYAGPKRYFPEGRIELRVDADATRAKLTADLKALADGVKPDDLLVVFFAGHGDAPPGKRPADPGSFVFCCPDYSPQKPGDTAVSAEELFDALAGVNCRKVVFLDACRAGRATEANVLRRLVPEGQGPVVIASCGPGEDSFEDQKFGHGLFTVAILDALDKDKDFDRADYNSDGVISPGELFDYVSARLPGLLRATGRKPDAQVPICFPRQPPKFPFVRK